MVTDVSSIRLAKRDTVMLDHFVKEGLFQSKSDFIRYAIRKAINEMILRDIREDIALDEDLANITPDDLQKEIKEIRKRLWEEYSENLS